MTDSNNSKPCNPVDTEKSTQKHLSALHFSVLTLFPELLRPFTQEALLGKAAQRGLLSFDLINLREYAANKHHKVDDTPYGGGAGMVVRVDVVERALGALSPSINTPDTLDAPASVRPPDEVILLSPAGERFDQRLAEELSQKQHLVLLCGRYEGFDVRSEQLISREVSIGDFVMMGGEAAAACLLEAIGRLRAEVLGDAASHEQDSFSTGLLDYPEYTRPAVWRDQAVPDVLLGGNHAAIALWRRTQALKRTLERRPDLLVSAALTPQDSVILSELGATPEQLDLWQAPPAPTKRTKTKRKKRTQNNTQSKQ